MALEKRSTVSVADVADVADVAAWLLEVKPSMSTVEAAIAREARTAAGSARPTSINR
jgi:hypothetical protein